MRKIKIPVGQDASPLLKERGPVDRRSRFFDVILGIVDQTKFKPVEMVEVSTWVQQFIDARDNTSVKTIDLRDKEHEKLRSILESFEGYIGIGAAETIKAVTDAEDTDDRPSAKPE